MKDLTKRQAAVLAYMRSYVAEFGLPPTIRQIGEHFGISSPNGVVRHLRALERKGHVTHHPGENRNWRPVCALSEQLERLWRELSVEEQQAFLLAAVTGKINRGG